MKGKGKQVLIITTILILAISESTVIINKGETKGIKPLTTQITNINYTKIDYTSLHKNHTHFRFIIEFNLANPNSNKVLMVFSFYGEVFYLKMDITFYDTDFEVYNDTYLGGFWAMDYVYVQPGIQQLQIDYILSIEQKDLEQLPNGRYDLCVAECNSEAQVEYYHSLLIMRNGEQVIKYTVNTIILNQAIIFVISCVCIVFATDYFKKN